MKKKKNFLLFLLIFGYFFSSVFGSSFSGKDLLQEQINQQHSLGNRPIFIGTGSVITPGIEYINEMGNSDVRGNFFQGSYYDPFYGLFQLDWSEDKKQNVRVIGGTSKCENSYGYRLGGSALSDVGGKIFFDYDDEHQVYYCLNTQTLHGKAYSSLLGPQDFQGIAFSLLPPPVVYDIEFEKSNVFLNDNTMIVAQELSQSQQNYTQKGESRYYTSGGESIFYIFKKK